MWNPAWIKAGDAMVKIPVPDMAKLYIFDGPNLSTNLTLKGAVRNPQEKQLRIMPFSVVVQSYSTTWNVFVKKRIILCNVGYNLWNGTSSRESYFWVDDLFWLGAAFLNTPKKSTESVKDSSRYENLNFWIRV